MVVDLNKLMENRMSNICESKENYVGKQISGTHILPRFHTCYLRQKRRFQ